MTGRTTKIEEAMDAVLDILLVNDGTWTGPWAKVLSSLASEVHGEAVPVGDVRYHRTSTAVLRLEAIGLVHVDRAYTDRPEKANVVQRISLA